MISYQYGKSHCGDKMVERSSYLHNGISYSGKMSSLYWYLPLMFITSSSKATLDNIGKWVTGIHQTGDITARNKDTIQECTYFIWYTVHAVHHWLSLQHRICLLALLYGVNNDTMGTCNEFWLEVSCTNIFQDDICRSPNSVLITVA